MFSLNLCLYRVIVTPPKDDFKTFVVASNGIMSILFCENRSCCSKLWKKYADDAIVSLAFFYSCQGGKSATECRKVTRESIGQKSSVAVTCFYRRGRVNMDVVPAARRGHIVTHPLPSCPIHQLHSVSHSFVLHAGIQQDCVWSLTWVTGTSYVILDRTPQSRIS